MMETESVSKTLVDMNILMQVSAQEDFIEKFWCNLQGKAKYNSHN